MVQTITFVLAGALLFLGFRVLESSWSYRISKPFKWEEAIKAGTISARLKKMERLYRDKVRFYTFWLQTQRLRAEQIPGAFAEVGVYKGDTAAILHEMDPARKFLLFDSFAGFPATDLQKDAIADENRELTFADTDVEYVKANIAGNDNVEIRAGYFPETAAGVSGPFALVHLDADLYEPTLAGLRLFYPLLSPGGVIIIHDYNHNWSGARKAVLEFVATIPENIVEVADWQGSALLIANRV